MIFSPLNRTSAPQILRLCLLCYKNGILDAYELGDDYAAKEFIDNHKSNWTYGVLGEPDDYDWKMWRFSLYKWCRRHSLSKFADNYLYEIKRYNYLFCPLIFSMRFYLMGIEAWLSYPNPTGIEIFRQNNAVHWGPPFSGSKKFSRKDLLVEIQGMVYEYRRLPEEKLTVLPRVIDDFSSALFDLTNKYVIKKKIIIDGKSVKNL